MLTKALLLTFTNSLKHQQMRAFATVTKLTNIKALHGFKRDGTYVQEKSGDCEIHLEGGKITYFGSAAQAPLKKE